MDSAIEYLFPLLMAAALLAVYPFVQMQGTSPTHQYKFNFILTSIIPMLAANSCRFILFQAVKEKEMNVYNSLLILNMRSAAFGLSYFMTQCPNSIYTTVLLTAVSFTFIEETSYIPLFFLAVLLFLISMNFYALAVSTIFHDSKLSTQIGLLLVLVPAIFYHSFELYAFSQDNYRSLIYAFSFLPHFPCMALLQKYLNAYVDNKAYIVNDDD